MHNFFTGLMGFFASIGMFFHGVHVNLPNNTKTSTVMTGSPSGTITSHPGRFGMGGDRTNLPQGERTFIGMVTNVNGSTITVQLQMRTRPFGTTPSITPTPQNITINLDSATTFSGGSQTNITTNTKVAGVLKTNTDGSFTAVSIQINPSMPSGFLGRGGIFGKIPAGSQPIFGQVTAVNGNQLGIQSQGRNGNGSKVTVDLTSNTQYTGGSQTDIQSGIRIAGYGTVNTDGSINAQQITINPTFPDRGENNGQ